MLEYDILTAHGAVINEMDKKQVSMGSRILFIASTLCSVVDDFSFANHARSNRVFERFSHIVKASQVRFYTGW